MNTEDDKNWKSIFAVLLDEPEAEVGGRSSPPVPEELRGQLERMAKGECDEETVRKICDEIAVSPEAIRIFARLLKESDRTTGTGEGA